MENLVPDDIRREFMADIRDAGKDELYQAEAWNTAMRNLKNELGMDTVSVHFGRIRDELFDAAKEVRDAIVPREGMDSLGM
jgi:hypothetical protein